jgi:hypothetical protein
MAFPEDHSRLEFIGSRRLIAFETPSELLPLCVSTSRALPLPDFVPSGLRLEAGNLQNIYPTAGRGSAG